MLYVKDEHGTYHPAPKETVFSEAKRLSGYQLRRGAVIESSVSARDAIGQRIGGYQYEMFACLFLDNRHRVLAFEEMFRGTINVSTVYPRELVKEALHWNAAAVILAHNHPSGETQASQQDLELTNQLKKILQVINVRVLDHLIVGEHVLSLADSGLI